MVGLNALQALAARRGLADQYLDYKGQLTGISDSRKTAILATMGYPIDPEGLANSVAALDRQEALQRLPPVVVLRPHTLYGFMFREHADALGSFIHWTIALESGGTLSGEAVLKKAVPSGITGSKTVDFAVPFRDTIPLGYHRLSVVWNGGHHHTILIQSPDAAYRPDSLSEGQRIWGPSIQLYTLRSDRNWGMGDFTDLAELVDTIADLGADFIGLNPIHALYPISPEHASPYSPSNRNWLNGLYIDPTQVLEFQLSEACQNWYASDEVATQLDSVRANAQVDYTAVSALKWQAFDMMYRGFVATHLALGTARAQKFAAFVEMGGEGLWTHCVFDALLQHFHVLDANAWGWPMWPEAYQRRNADEVLAFEEAHPDAVQKHLYVQFIAMEQLQQVHHKTIERGMALGLYRDLAVGADRGGSEIWQDPTLFCIDASVGAPPDALGPMGQNWGLPPIDPMRLQATGYQHFIELIRQNMQACGALRMDHAMALARLWWCPPGETAAEGCYVAYPLEDLLGIILLESHRQQCLVIAEDLGTVPDDVRVAFPRAQLYSNKVFYFEIGKSGCTAPQDYPKNALAMVANHDMPTLAAYWDGSDLTLRQSLGMLSSEAVFQQEKVARLANKGAIIAALRRYGDMPDREWTALGGELAVESLLITESLNVAIHQFLASTPTQLVALQLEDLLLMSSPVNVPGTSSEYGNWRRKLTVNTSALLAKASVKALCHQVDLTRKQPLGTATTSLAP